MIAGACARQRKDGHMEENTQKFLERMNELVALGKKKKAYSMFRRSMILYRYGTDHRTDGESV